MKLKYVSWIPATLIMVIIFNFSAKTAVESDGSSLQIANYIMDINEKLNGKFTDLNQKKELLLQINHIIRKLAHGMEYCVLAISVSLHLQICDFKHLKLFLTAIFISGAYSITDEFHQLFVVGRSCSIIDVLIDTTGAVFGAACFMLASLLLNRLEFGKKTTI